METLTYEENEDLFSGCLAGEDIATPTLEAENQPNQAQTTNSGDAEAAIAEILPDFDTLAVGEKIAKDTVVLEMHIGTAGVRRKLDAKKLIKNDNPEPCEHCYPYQPGDERIFRNTGEKVEELVDRDECDFCLGTGTVKHDVDPEYFHAAKDIIDIRELRPINKRISQLKKFRNARCVKASMLANGFYVLPKKFINEVDAEIESAKQDINLLLDKMESRWEEMIESAKPKLREHWSRADYPPFSIWRKEWEITSRLRGLNVPALLNEYNEKLAKREYEKLRMDWADTAQEVRDALRSGFTFLVTDFANKLGRDEKGDFKQFTKNLIEKLTNFCETFEARDLTGDNELSVLAKEVKDMVAGVDPKSLRKDEALRGAFELAFKQIADKASKLTVVRERTIAFDDEDL